MRRLLLGLLLFAVSPLAGAAVDGAALYARHCAACHGETGRGGVGVPLALPDFLASVDDDYLLKTIRYGRPGRVMTGFKSLSDAEVGAIVAYIRSWMPAGLKVDIPKAPVKGDIARGKPLYDRYCASCHGASGEGGHGTGVTFSRPRDFPIIAPAINNPGYLDSASDQVIKASLIKDREGTPMTSFLKEGLSEQDIDDIVAYVRSFDKQPPAWKPAEGEEPTLSMESPYSLEQTVENVKRAVVGANFRVVRVQNLEDGLFPEAKQNKHQLIIYFCNFNFINKALALDPRVGMFMPCRITVLERDGKVTLMTVNPKYMSGLFNNAELEQPCTEMHQTYQAIMEEATL